jgi:hypothetical protein
MSPKAGRYSAGPITMSQMMSSPAKRMSATAYDGPVLRVDALVDLPGHALLKKANPLRPIGRPSQKPS